MKHEPSDLTVKGLRPYIPLTMIGETEEDRRAIKDALSLGYFLWVTEDGKVLRESDYKYIANVVPLKEGQEPAWKPPFDFDIDLEDFRLDK